MKTKIITVVVIVVTATALLRAEVVPGRWEKLDRLEPGSKIVLTSKAGDRVRYTFKSSDPSSLTVRDRDGRELVIPKSHVAKVVQQNPRSSKPAWIGAAIGGGTGVAMGLAAKGDEGPFAKREVAAPFLGLIGAAVGFTVGYLAAENPPDAVLYLAGPCK